MYNLFRFILESNGWTPYFLYSLLEFIIQCRYASIYFSNYILLHESLYLVTFVKITVHVNHIDIYFVNSMQLKKPISGGV